MNKIEAIIKIKKDDEEEIITKVIGKISDNSRKISYYDGQVKVNINIDDQITMKRSHPDYELTLIFDKNNKTSSIYKIYNPLIKIDVEVETRNFLLDSNNIFIEYLLKLNNEEVGVFQIDISWLNV